MAAQLERQAAAAVAEAAEEAADELEEFSVSGQAALQGRVLLESAGPSPGSLCHRGRRVVHLTMGSDSSSCLSLDLAASVAAAAAAPAATAI